MTNQTNQTNQTSQTNQTTQAGQNSTAQEAVKKTVSPVGVVKEVVNQETKDLYLAAALHCEGCRYLKIDKTDPSRMVFVFEGGELADRVSRQWYEGVLVVSATAYAASLRLMKSLIHN